MRFLMTVLTIAVLAAPLAGQTEKQAALEEMIALVQRDVDPNLWAIQFSEWMAAKVRKGSTPLTMEQLNEVESKFQKLVREELQSPENVRRIIEPWLDRTFTATELVDLLAFYRTPTGRKAITSLLSARPFLGEAMLQHFRTDLENIADEVTRGEIDQMRLIRRTAAEMRSIATAAEAYATDHNRYPAARDLTELNQFLTPTYLRRLPETDAWGTPFLYLSTSDGRQYRIVSAGADRKIDPESQQATMFFIKQTRPTLTDDPNADLIFQDGSFQQISRMAMPAPPPPAVPPQAVPLVPLRPIPPGVYRVGSGVRAPHVIERIDPQYPAEARAARIQGLVILEAIIDQNGRVTDLQVLKSLPYGLDQAAMEAVRQWRFAPATKDGQPVAVVFNLTVNFKLAKAAPPLP